MVIAFRGSVMRCVQNSQEFTMGNLAFEILQILSQVLTERFQFRKERGDLPRASSIGKFLRERTLCQKKAL